MLNGCYCPDILEYLPILPLWTGIILSRTGDEEETKASNAVAKNWFRIVKHPIFESNIHIRPGNFIRTMYSNIHDIISAFKFGSHPLGSRIFRAKKRKLEVPNEEDCKEKWSRRSKIHRSYVTPDIDNVDKVFDKCYLTLNNTSPSVSVALLRIGATHLKLTADMRLYSSRFIPCRMLYTLLSDISYSVNFVPIIAVES